MYDNEKMNEICKMKDRLQEIAYTALMHNNPNNFELHSLGEVIDMIKDLSEVEKNMAEAECYSEMSDGQNESRGYDNWRYSNGRYAPKGLGHYSPRHFIMPEMVMDDYMDEDYKKYPFGDYVKARKHYTDTHSKDSKDAMEKRAIESVMEIWQDADPILKNRIMETLKD